MTTTIICDPQGSGKSSAAVALMGKFRCKRLVDEWNGRDGLPRNALVMTNLLPAQVVIPAGAQMLTLQEALGQA